MNNIIIEDKGFLIEESKGLLKELDMFAIEHNWGVVNKKILKDEESIENTSITQYFVIEKKQEPIYMGINKIEDVEEVNNIIFEKLDILRENINNLLTNFENKISTSTEEAINGIFRIVINCKKVATKQLRATNFESDITAQELSQQYGETLSKLLDQRLVKTIMSSIYEGMKHGDINEYRAILSNINKFLQEIGAYTMDIKFNVEPNYDYIEPIQSDDAVTTDYSIDGTVKEIYKYPYVFDNINIISEGQVVIWRKA